LTRGFWFVFPCGAHTIRAWGSAFSGLERVYVDDALVSERRSGSRDSEHAVSVAGSPYRIVFKTLNLLKGSLECRLLKDGRVVRAYAIRPSERGALRGKSGVVLAVLTGVAIGGALGFLDVSENFRRGAYLVGGVLVVLVWTLARRGSGSFLVVEETTTQT
jgi:hypothetical protein